MWFGYKPQNIFVTFWLVEPSHFSGIIYNNVNGQGIPCGRNVSYSFVPILSEHHWCSGHGLKICMWFGYNPQIFFVIFLQVELSHFSDIIYNKINARVIPWGATPPTVNTNSFETSLFLWSWSEDMHVAEI